jgi:hypothetical protein
MAYVYAMYGRVYIYIYKHTYIHGSLLLRTRVNKKMWSTNKHSIVKMTQWICASQRTEKRSNNMREMRAYYG